MEELNKKTIIICSIIVCILILGGVFYFTKVRKNIQNRENNNIQENSYKEDEYTNLDDVLKKDKALIKNSIDTLPFVSGLHQSIYNEEKVTIDNIKKELLFTKAYYSGVDKISNDLNEYNELISKYNIESDFFVKEETIVNKVKELYNIEVSNFPNEIELIGGSAKKYGEYYAFLFKSEPYGIGKYTKVLSYDISDETLIIYEKPMFYTYDGIEKALTIYSNDKLLNPIVKIEDIDFSLDTIKKYYKENSDKLVVYEHIFIKNNNKYYWNNTNSAKDDKE